MIIMRNPELEQHEYFYRKRKCDGKNKATLSKRSSSMNASRKRSRPVNQDDSDAHDSGNDNMGSDASNHGVAASSSVGETEAFMHSKSRSKSPHKGAKRARHVPALLGSDSDDSDDDEGGRAHSGKKMPPQHEIIVLSDSDDDADDGIAANTSPDNTASQFAGVTQRLPQSTQPPQKVGSAHADVQSNTPTPIRNTIREKRPMPVSSVAASEPKRSAARAPYQTGDSETLASEHRRRNKARRERWKLRDEKPNDGYDYDSDPEWGGNEPWTQLAEPVSHHAKQKSKDTSQHMHVQISAKKVSEADVQRAEDWVQPINKRVPSTITSNSSTARRTKANKQVSPSRPVSFLMPGQLVKKQRAHGRKEKQTQSHKEKIGGESTKASQAKRPQRQSSSNSNNKNTGHAAAPLKQKFPLGTRVRKYFPTRGWRRGSVQSYLHPCYNVEFRGGIEEQLVEAQVQKILDDHRPYEVPTAPGRSLPIKVTAPWNVPEPARKGRKRRTRNPPPPIEDGNDIILFDVATNAPLLKRHSRTATTTTDGNAKYVDHGLPLAFSSATSNRRKLAEETLQNNSGGRKNVSLRQNRPYEVSKMTQTNPTHASRTTGASLRPKPTPRRHRLAKLVEKMQHADGRRA